MKDAKLALILLGEELAEENDAARDLWTWLPSYAVTVKHHGDQASVHCPSNRDVMKEAAMYLGQHLKHPKTPLTREEQVWFTSCACGDAHASEP